jgi:hypothetical protein
LHRYPWRTESSTDMHGASAQGLTQPVSIGLSWSLCF